MRDDGTKDVQIMVPLKYLSNFWRTLEMLLINCESWSANCIISGAVANQATAFSITDKKSFMFQL